MRTKAETLSNHYCFLQLTLREQFGDYKKVLLLLSKFNVCRCNSTDSYFYWFATSSLCISKYSVVCDLHAWLLKLP